MSKKVNPYFWLIVVGAFSLLACVRNDDEPTIPVNSISRLYVSLAEFQNDETQDPYQNLVIFDPADGEQIRGLSFNSQVNGGGSILFNPYDSRIFQASTNNGGIQMMSVSEIGIPNRTGRLSNDTLTGIRALEYDHINKMLFVSNALTPSGIFVFDNPLNRNGEIKPFRHFPLNGERPWAMHYWQDSLLVVRTGANAGINLYTGVQRAITTEAPDLTPASVLTIEGASGARGMAYSPKLDMLVLADFEKSRILFFENLRGAFKSANATLVPTRVLMGGSTGLTSPIDVSIDDRSKGMLLYVADRNSKSVLRFPLNVEGNTSPNYVFQLNLTPESIYVDARGDGM